MSVKEKLFLTDHTCDALRGKLTAPDSPLQPWWDHFVTLGRQFPEWYSEYTVLTALMTRREDDIERAVNNVRRFVQLKEEGDTSQDAQIHTHVTAAPLARWAVYCDWLAQEDLLSPSDLGAAREAMIDHAFVFPMQHVRSRAREFDNQMLANALSASTVGYVFGLRTGDSAEARELFNTGLDALSALLGRAPEGGYGLEGSTYQASVVFFLMSMAGQFYQTVTDIPVFEEGLPPDNQPLISVLEIDRKMIGPSGNLPGWDDYGFSPARVKSGLALLARLTGNPEPLDVLVDQNMWYHNSLSAWGHDDRLWTLAWWPEELQVDGEMDYDAWMEPAVGGALQEGHTRCRLMQYWDECGGVGLSGRPQVDPNTVTLEAFDSPIIIDGHLELPDELMPMDVEGAREYTGMANADESVLRRRLKGAVAWANGLIFDNEPWYVPHEPVHGTGEALHQVGPLQVVRADTADYYADRYDVESVIRSSMLIEGQFGVISDCVRSESPHKITWQAYMREGSVEEGENTVRIQTPEQVDTTIHFLGADEGVLHIDEVPEGPQPFVSSSRCQYSLPETTETRLDTVMIPQSCLKRVNDLTDGWRMSIDDEVVADEVPLDEAYLRDPGTDPRTARMFQKTVSYGPNSDEAQYLVVQRAKSSVSVRINGQEIEMDRRLNSGGHWDINTLLPWVYRIDEALEEGENDITIAAEYYYGDTVCGPVHLCQYREPSDVQVEQESDRQISLNVGDQKREILADNVAGTVEWAGGRTDARYAVSLPDGTLAATELSCLKSSGSVNIQSSKSIDVAWNEGQTTVKNLSVGTNIEIEWAKVYLRIECRGCLEVVYQGSREHVLNVGLPRPMPVLVNGERRDASGDVVTLHLSPANASRHALRGPGTPEDVYELTQVRGSAAEDQLLEALKHGDWRTQVAAADEAGRLGIEKAGPILLDIFRKEGEELSYPGLQYWWSWSKMARNPGSQEGMDESLPRPLAVKRWRVRRAAVTALGKLEYQKALEPLLEAFEEGEDFFTVKSQIAVALGRLGDEKVRQVLDKHTDHPEFNTRHHVRLAVRYLRGEIDRTQYDELVTG